MNRYLQRRRDRMMRDGRNPYGSRGGYVSSRKRDRASDSGDYIAKPTGRYDYGYDYGYDYAEEDEKKEYEKKLKEWTEKLKKKDRFGWQKEMVIKRAREMQIKFDEISEDEFYAVYLMLVSDFKSYSNDPNTYVSMAKDWIYDDDIKVSPSEKICIYLYEIVLGEE